MVDEKHTKGALDETQGLGNDATVETKKLRAEGEADEAEASADKTRGDIKDAAGKFVDATKRT